MATASALAPSMEVEGEARTCGARPYPFPTALKRLPEALIRGRAPSPCGPDGCLHAHTCGCAVTAVRRLSEARAANV